MKLGLLADIHGNCGALRAVLDGARRESVEVLCVAGDYVGYYYHPGEVLEALDAWPSHRVRGNHEDLLACVRAAPSSLETIENHYGSGLRCALEDLSFDQIDALLALPPSIKLNLGGCTLLVAHGAPWSVDKYVYPNCESADWRRLAALGADLIVLGHTHYRMRRQVGRTTIVNPGSVGQPRDRIPGAAWASFDTETKVVRQHVEPYDFESVAAEARRRDPRLPYLREVLTRT
jgi:putative phosphoesterase